jgi:DNA-binding transcriptional LysR family regulator
VVLPFLSALRAQAPNIRVAVQPIDLQALPAQLDRGEVDMALITPQEVGANLHSAHLFEERYVCVMRAGHPDASASPLALERFCALDHVLVASSGGAFEGVTDVALAKIGRARRVILSVTSFLVLPEILLASDQIAVVPQRLAIHHDGLLSMDPPVDIPGFSKTLARANPPRQRPSLGKVPARSRVQNPSLKGTRQRKKCVARLSRQAGLPSSHQRILHRQTQLRSVQFRLRGIAAMQGVAQGDRQLSGRSGLHHILGLQVSLPMATALAIA